MGIIYPQKVVVSAAGNLYKHLLDLGYQAKYRQKIEIDIEHLMPNSKIKVWMKCDFCGKEFKRKFSPSNKQLKTSCSNCKKLYITETRVNMLPEEQRKYHDREWIYHQYVDLDRSATNIASECGVTTQTIESVLIKYGVRKTPTYEEAKDLLSRDVIYDLHIIQGYGVRAIADMYKHIGETTIRALMAEYGIEALDKCDLHKLFWQRSGTQEKMSSIRKELWNNEEYRRKTLAHLQDEDAIKARAIRYSANYQGVSIEAWGGFITPENTRVRGSAEYDDWRYKVFDRDDYTCQCCGVRSCVGSPVILHAHHLDSFASNIDKRFDVNNGVTLCNKCHDPREVGSFHNIYGTSNNTKEQYQEYIVNRATAI